MKRALAALVALGIGAWSGCAFAQKANESTVIVSAERLTGFYWWKSKVEFPGPDDESDGVMINFLTVTTNPNDGIGINPFAAPRIGVDGVILDGLSLGGNFGIAHAGADNGPDTTVILFGFRAGYIFSFSDLLSLWPRGGFTFAKASTDLLGGNVDVTAFELTLEANLLITPVEHVGITVGPVFDIGLGGDVDAGPGSADLNFHNLGLAAGIALLF